MMGETTELGATHVCWERYGEIVDEWNRCFNPDGEFDDLTALDMPNVIIDYVHMGDAESVDTARKLLALHVNQMPLAAEVANA